jgi:acyl carrier protein
MDIKQTLRAFIVDSFLMGDEEAALSDGASLLDQGVLDSTGVLELVAFLEKSFDITVAITEMVPDNLDSLDAIASFVQRKQTA